MKYVKLESTKLVVNDLIAYPFFENPEPGKNKKVKVVCAVNELRNIESYFLNGGCFSFRDNCSGFNLNLTVVYCFNDSKYYYFNYNENPQAVRSNFQDRDITLEVINNNNYIDIIETKVPNYNFQEQMFFCSDFPAIDYRTFDFGSLQEYRKTNLIGSSVSKLKTSATLTKQINKILLPGPAICACGFVNEYVENYGDYECQQCKLFKHMAS